MSTQRLYVLTGERGEGEDRLMKDTEEVVKKERKPKKKEEGGL